ncbi:integrase [Amycolatopsis lexingtonensis]|uniref:Integrase n=1 Tax=Amycolatopsis lexingtonensis TaxID=218822 RepID=A0ABR9IHQ4_9PSEU|nr:tyrosine-type recombinase/integrase [Amycolatopsis lexingtonensis]MBE1502696.1 integrase [Amycolatopsis lexingtonensis]
MSDLTYDVKIWNIETRSGKRKTSYRVTWFVAGERFDETANHYALAESFRSDLVAAARRGEAFDRIRGLPISKLRSESDMPFFAFACKYVDMKWPRAAGKSRAGNADALASALPAMLSTTRGRPEDGVLRRALTGWAFNKKRRDNAKPAEIERALKWLQANTLPVSRMDDTAKLREVLDQISLKLDGTQAAAKTVNRKRAVIYNALEYAHELKLIRANRLSEVKWTAPKSVRAIDKRVVINPAQGKRLLAAVAAQKVDTAPRRSSGPMLKAYFAVMYYAALRPEEAAMLCKRDLQLPESGWGELLLSETAPVTGAAWTDSGERRDRRQLKQRGKGEVRPVPSPPPLTAILHEHLSNIGTAADGRLFRNLTGGDIAESTVARVWNNARRAALTEEEYASPLAKRPYDLRHACVSTWLAAGVPSTQCAEWAGHSVAVLHQIYAKVIAGLESAAHQRIEQALDWRDQSDE